MRRVRNAILVVALGVLLCAGCAHTPRRTRVARTLVATGSLLVVGGGLLAAGCGNGDGQCDPDTTDIAAGAATGGVGAALIVTGFLLRPPRPVLPPPSPQRSVPPPVTPDPFDKPMAAPIYQ